MLGCNIGLPTAQLQLDFEYKNGAWAGGINTSIGMSWLDWDKYHMEIGLLVRYYITLDSSNSFYITVDPLLVTGLYYLDSPLVKFGFKVGVGFDRRLKYLRYALEGGFQYYPEKYFQNYFYVQFGLGYLFCSSAI